MTGRAERPWVQQIEAELRGNILPFWSEKPVDHAHGGFYGALTNDPRILDDTPRTVVLTARILWTFSAAYRRYADPGYLRTARHTYDAICRRLWDDTYGGIFWAVDRHGRPAEDRKHTYAQAFTI